MKQRDVRQPILSVLGCCAFFIWIVAAGPYGNTLSACLSFGALVSVIALSIIFNRNPESA